MLLSGTGSSPGGSSSAPASRMRTRRRARRARARRPHRRWCGRCARAGRRSSPFATPRAGCRSSRKDRIVQSSSTCTYFSTCGTPSMTTRSKPTPDFESLWSIGARSVTPARSSSSDEATGHGTGSEGVSSGVTGSSITATPRSASSCPRPHPPRHDAGGEGMRLGHGGLLWLIDGLVRRSPLWVAGPAPPRPPQPGHRRGRTEEVDQRGVDVRGSVERHVLIRRSS